MADGSGGRDRPRFLPCAELVAILRRAYDPCPNFSGDCAGIARWHPIGGHVPRGFTGAFGALDDIELVIVFAEPGNPLPEEAHDTSRAADSIIADVSAYAFAHFEQRTTQFHRNLRRILDLCWPGMVLYEQLTRTWLTESYLCSAPTESGPVPAISTRRCAQDYLMPQLRLFGDRAVVACGGKARARLRKSTTEFLAVGAVAPPGGNQPKVRASWAAIPAYIAARSAGR